MLMLCWFLPLLFLSVIIFSFVDSKMQRQMEETVITSMDKAVEICQMRLDEAVTASKAASYLPTISQIYLTKVKIPLPAAVYQILIGAKRGGTGGKAKNAVRLHNNLCG